MAFTNMENVGPKGGFFLKGYTNVYQSNGRYYITTSASGKCPGAEAMGNDVTFSGSTSLIVNGNVVQTQNFALPGEATFSDANFPFLGVTNMQLPTSGSVQLRINASYIMEDDAGGRAVPLPSLTRTLTLHK